MQNKEIWRKAKQTCLKKYGTKYPQNLEESKIKQKETLMKKYGVDNPMKVPKFKEKIKDTFLKKYGCTSILGLPEIQEKIKETNLKKYGVPYACMRKECREANKGVISKINISISKLLNKNNIKNKLEFNLNNYSYDIKILDSNVLLEINPTYTHNSTNTCWFNKHKKEPLNKNYHYDKTLNAKENGYRCIHIWDWDNIYKIINMLKSKEKIYARKCEIYEISEKDCNDFLNENHLQGTCKGQKIKLGLYYLGKLVQVMTFGKPRYNKKYEYELIRLCSNSRYAIIGGTEKLFKYFIEHYNPNAIISYCDNSKFDGEIYNKLNFKLLDYGKPSKHWYNSKTKKHITDNLLRQRGYDQLFKTNYGKGTSNKKLMIENGFVEIYDSGQSIYIWEKE